MVQYRDVLGPAMQGFLDCVEAAFDADGRGVGRTLLVPGDNVPDDWCDCDGQLYVRVITQVPNGQQPNCPPISITATLGVGVIRCAAVLDDNGNPPPAATLTAEALAMTQDAATIYGALVCCSPSLVQARLINRVPTIGTWNPQGPLGGCARGEWTLGVNLDVCACP